MVIKKINEIIKKIIEVIVNFIKKLGMIFFISLGVEIYTIFRLINNFETVYIIFFVLLTSYIIELLQIRFSKKEED